MTEQKLKSRGLRNRLPFSSTIDGEVLSRLKEYSLDTGIPISKILDKALDAYLRSTEK